MIEIFKMTVCILISLFGVVVAGVLAVIYARLMRTYYERNPEDWEEHTDEHAAPFKEEE